MRFHQAIIAATLLVGPFAWANAEAACLTKVTVITPNGGQVFQQSSTIHLQFAPDCPTSIPPCCPYRRARIYLSSHSGAQGTWTEVGQLSPWNFDFYYHPVSEDCSTHFRFGVLLEGLTQFSDDYWDESDSDFTITGCPPIPSAEMSTVEWYSTSHSLVVTPDPNSAPSNSEYTGAFHTDITVRDNSGTPLPNIQVNWVLLGGMVKCTQPQSSGVTDATGHVVLEARGGGYGLSYIQARVGNTQNYVSLTGTVTTRSPDFDGAFGNGLVNLSDLIAFSNEFNNVVQTHLHDYNNSGATDLTDLLLMEPAFSSSAHCTLAGGMALSQAPVEFAELDEARDKLAQVRRTVEQLPGSDERERGLGAVQRIGALLNETPVSVPEGSRLLSVRANPFTREGAVDFDFGATLVREARVIDATGRLVRTISQGVGRGSGVLIWDGQTDSGERATPGIYFMAVTTERGTPRRSS